MTAKVVANQAQGIEAVSPSYERFAGSASLLAAAAGLLYSVAFVVLKDQLLYSLFLMLGGLFTTGVLVALYERVRSFSPSFALLALLLGIVGALGSAIHGGYDLSNAVNSPTSDPIAAANLPNELDPRGLLTFGLAGLSVLLFSWLISHVTYFPKNLGYLGYLLGVLMVVIYFVRLIILDPNASPIIPAVLGITGVIVSPAWYAWLGLVFLRGGRTESSAS
ncbi:MAG: hypothetical protein ABI670_14605 [Chloroflexota bacterium]